MTSGLLAENDRTRAADYAFARHTRIKEIKKVITDRFLELGGELYWMEKNREYEDLGHPSFNSYLSDPEVDIRRSTAYMLKAVWLRYRAELSVQPDRLVEAGVSKLNLLLPIVDEKNVEEWVSKAATLSRTDLKRELGKLPDWEPCQTHQWHTVELCSVCGKHKH